MPIITISAVGTAILGLTTWLGNLPKEFTYLIFLAGLATDAGISILTGFETGVFGTIFSLLISQMFAIPNFVVTSPQLFVIFCFMPLVLFLLKNSLSHQ